MQRHGLPYLSCAFLALVVGARAEAADLEKEGFGGDAVVITQETSGYPGDELGETNLYIRAHYNHPLSEDLKLFIEGETGQGFGVQPFAVSPHWGITDTYFDLPLAVVELRQLYMRLANDNPYDLIVGHVDVTEHFNRNRFAKDEFAQFMAPAFVTDPIIDFPSRNFPGGPGDYTTPAAIFGMKLTDNMWVRLAAAEYTPSPAALGGAFWSELFHEDAFWIAEAELKLAEKSRLLVDVWMAPTMQSQWSTTELDPTGLSVSFDHEVNGLGIFARLGFRSSNLYVVDSALSGGVLYSNPAWGEENVLGVGLSISSFSKDFISDIDPPDAGDETQIEIFFRWKLPFGVNIIPDLQYIVNPGGDTSADKLTVFGVRCHLPF